MNDEARREMEREMIEDAERIMAEVNSNPELKNLQAPEDALDNILKAIREYEEEQAKENLSEEDKELLRLGQIYQKKRSRRKYWAIAVATILALACGITSVGGPEKIFNQVSWWIGDRKQENVDSEGTKANQTIEEEEAYEKINEEYGILPVRMMYVPEGVEFQEATIGNEVQGIHLIYGDEEKISIAYTVRPNFQNGSWSKDVEDELIEEYEMKLERVNVQIKKYLVEDKLNRWLIQFEYKDVSYSIYIMNLDQSEMEAIMENLYFY